LYAGCGLEALPGSGVLVVNVTLDPSFLTDGVFAKATGMHVPGKHAAMDPL
jgi:hypothetical protein